MQYFSVKNWDDFQHYRDRTPPWIKLHRTLLDDYAFSCLQDASKSHLMLIWLLASQLENRIPYDAVWVRNKIGAKEDVDLNALKKAGFISVEHDASNVQAERSPEVETEVETEVEKEVPPLPPTDDDLLAECVSQYNVMAGKHGLSACQVLSDPRRKAMRGRLKDCGGLEGWKVVLEIVAASDFLTGRKKDWKASLDFILQKSSFIKIMEGQYNNHKPSQQAGGGSYFDQMLEAARAACQTFREERHDHSPYDDVRV